MRKNEEIRAYLNYVMEHEGGCPRESCPTCQSARNIYQSVSDLIFSGVSYPEVTITVRRTMAKATAPTTGGRKTSAKKAA